MKYSHLLNLVMIVFLSGCVAGTAPTPATEEGQRAEAEALVRFSLTGRIVAGVEESYTRQVGAYLAGREVPAEVAAAVVSEEIAQLSALEEQRLVETLAPVYRRFYTPEEIHQLLSFYRTDVAKKSMRVSGQIAAESREYVRLWHDHYGEELLQRVYERLEREGYAVPAAPGAMQ